MKCVSIQVFDDKAVVICPTCKKNKRIKVTAKRAKATCQICKENFSVLFYKKERKYFRKEVCIDGTVALLNDRKKKLITIQDLSCQGLKFCIKSRRF